MRDDIVAEAVARYAAGWFPMDEPGHPELPWWSVEERWVFELDAESLDRTRRKVRRSLRHGAAWELRIDCAFEEVLCWCALPRERGDGVWMTPRLQDLYRRLHRAGIAHAFELWVDGECAAGMIGVAIGRVAMLESMAHRIPHAGNVLLVRVLEALAAGGYELADVQTPTPHTERLGAHPIPRAAYERRLRRALSP
jgi:leucyl/phenylalanyl-tRNA--protein transferase